MGVKPKHSVIQHNPPFPVIRNKKLVAITDKMDETKYKQTDPENPFHSARQLAISFFNGVLTDLVMAESKPRLESN